MRANHAVSVRAYIDLLRPINCGIVAVGILIGAIITVGFGGLSDSALGLAAALLAGVAFTGAGNTLNDYFDSEVDAVNHPNRPIPSGQITRQKALYFTIGLFVVAVVMGLLVGPLPLLIIAINLVAMVSYELRFKRHGWSGNLMIGWLVASIFVFGGAAAYAGSIDSLQKVAWLGLLAFFATLGREVVKDIEDVTGDVGRRTLPMVIGVDRAGLVASASFFFAVVLSPLPYTTAILSPLYMGIVLVADAIFIYCAWFSSSKPSEASRVAKYGMVIALVAFLAGGFL